MKKVLIITVMLFSAFAINAQERRRPPFDPHRFQRDMEQFITQKAGLTPQQASAFFPVYREMQAKQRSLFSKMRQYKMLDPNDNKVCEEAIKKMDENDILMKKIQKEYHQKFMKILPAGKVLEVIRAEDSFHRQAFRHAASRRGHAERLK